MHSGQIFGLTGRWIVFVSGLICPLLFMAGWYLWRRKRPRNLRSPRR
ncbi:MAG: PepSY domain-containing protein [Nitrospira sp.]|nr:PepSY domain-containing protein [Nitrospira sp.]MBP6604430.1 PepSY domain-containing protein [Nitrospira sp.]